MLKREVYANATSIPSINGGKPWPSGLIMSAANYAIVMGASVVPSIE
jgi:hypothetical protein